MLFEKPPISIHKATSKQNNNAVFSILIPSWNNLPYLKLCIESIKKNSLYSHQIIVHVNEGTDGTLEWVKNEGIDYTHSLTNAGVCYAINAAAKLATTNYIAYFNDDMYACKYWDKHIWEQKTALGHDNFYISSTLIEPEFTNNPVVIAPHNFGTSPQNFNETALNEFASTLKHHNWHGSAWPPNVVSKQLFEKINGYSEEFSPGLGSDPDFAMKLWQEGVRDFIGVGNSFTYHFLSKSTGRVKRNNGRKQFAQKWGIPSSYFYKKVLKMGVPIRQTTKLTFVKNFSYLIAHLKALYISIK